MHLMTDSPPVAAGTLPIGCTASMGLAQSSIPQNGLTRSCCSLVKKPETSHSRTCSFRDQPQVATLRTMLCADALDANMGLTCGQIQVLAPHDIQVTPVRTL